MFYVSDILGRKGPLSVVWMAAHAPKRLSKAQVVNANIRKLIDMILSSDVKFSLRTTADLMVGICYLNRRQIQYIIADCNIIITQINSILMNAPVGRSRLTLPDREPMLPDIQLPELDEMFDLFVPPQPPSPSRLAKLSKITLNEILPDDDDMQTYQDEYGSYYGIGDNQFGPYEDIFAYSPQRINHDDGGPVMPLAGTSLTPGKSTTSLQQQRIDAPPEDREAEHSPIQHDDMVDTYPSADNFPGECEEPPNLPGPSNLPGHSNLPGPSRTHTRPQLAFDDLVLQPIDPAYRRRARRDRRRRYAPVRPRRRRRTPMAIDDVTQFSRQEMELQQIEARARMPLVLSVGDKRLTEFSMREMFCSAERALPSQLAKYFENNCRGEMIEEWQEEPEEEETEYQIPATEATAATDVPTVNYIPDQTQKETGAAVPAGTDATIPPLTTTIEPVIDNTGADAFEPPKVDNNDDQFFNDLLEVPEEARDVDESFVEISNSILEEVNQTITGQLNSTSEVFTFNDFAPAGTSKVKRALLFSSLLERINSGELQASQDSSFQAFTDIFITRRSVHLRSSPPSSLI